MGFKTIELKKNILDDNAIDAEALRCRLKEEGILLVNLMSSPGAGKTTTLLGTIDRLKDTYKLGVMEADIDSDVDAKKIEAAGARAIQLHTGGMCHLDAEMTAQGLDNFKYQDLDLIVLENVGNLVCPAEFDTGAGKNVMILSVPEGDDKPLKYPLMFSIVDLVLINKIDCADYFDFRLERVKEYIHKLNPEAMILPISAKTGEGMDAWTDWLKNEVVRWKEPRETLAKEV